MVDVCKVDHSSIEGKFCPACGSKKIDAKKICTNGHQMRGNAKFCADCGAGVLSADELCINGHSIKSGTKFCNSCGVATSNNVQAPTKPLSNRNRESISKPLTLGYQQQNVPSVSSFQSSNISGDATAEFGQQNSFEREKSNKNFVLVGISSLVALLFGIVILGSMNSGSAPVSVTVEMVLLNEYDCFDISWGYSDIPGGQVVLDVDGVKYFGSYPAFGSSSGSGCKFSTTISGVNSDGVNYSIGMASGRRGTIYNSKSELEANDWTFFLSLG